MAFIELAWNLTEPEDFLQYNLQYKRDTDLTWVGAQTVSTKDKKYKLTRLVNGTKYNFRLQAVDKYNNASEWVEYVKGGVNYVVAAKDTTPPAVVTGLSVSSAFKFIFIKWDPNLDTDLAEYVLQIATNSTFTVNLETYYCGSNGFTYQGEAGTAYYFRVRAIDLSGNFPVTGGPANDGWSEIVSSTPEVIGAADIDNFAVDASKMFSTVPVIKEAVSSIWTANTPAGGISWATHTLVYKNKIFTVAAGSTTNTYVTADLSGTAGSISYSSSGSQASGTDQFTMAKNTAGKLEIVWQAQANVVIGSAFIMDGAVGNLKVSDVAADKITTANLNATEYIGVNNGQVKLGKIGTNETGILVRNSNNTADVFKVNNSGTATLKNILVDGSISVGEDKLLLDGVNSQIKVRNAANTIDQVVIGKQASGSYGISVNKSDGTQVFRVNETEAVLRNVTVDTLTASSSISASVIKAGTLQLLKADPSENVSIQASKTSYSDTASGLWLGVDSGTPKVNIGNSTKYLKWDGTDLSISGNIVMAGGSISWASVAKPTYSAAEVGAAPSTAATYINSSGIYTGTLTASQVNTSGFVAQTANINDAAISTLKLANEAVLLPRYVFSDNYVPMHVIDTGPEVSSLFANSGRLVATITINPQVAAYKIIAFASMFGTGNEGFMVSAVRIYNTTDLAYHTTGYVLEQAITLNYQEFLDVGSNYNKTYKVELWVDTSSSISFIDCSLTVMGAIK